MPNRAWRAALAVTVVTKSGTNELHGSVFEYHDNQHLKARNFFQAAGSGQAAQHLQQLWRHHRRPDRKNKLFYFFSFDGTRQRQGAVDRYSVPTAAIRSGDFSAYRTVIYDPLTGNPDGTGRQPFAGNKIPASRIDPIAQKIQSYYPAAEPYRTTREQLLRLRRCRSSTATTST